MHFATVFVGLLFGLSLIVAVGPQNAFVLQQGVRRRHVTPVVAACTLSDVVLIAVGTAGAGAALTGHRTVTRAVGVVGIAFLLGYGAMAGYRAFAASPGLRAAGDAGPSLRAVLATCLAFTFLNPAVYVDTVVLVGPVSNSHGDAAWWFAAGAMAGSLVWFIALGFAGRSLAPWLTRPGAWRALDATVAVVMAVTAVRLAFSL